MKYYIYGMRLRGFSHGCQPMNGLVDHYPDTSGKYYDILVYARMLTADEVKNYELDELNYKLELGELLGCNDE